MSDFNDQYEALRASFAQEREQREALKPPAAVPLSISTGAGLIAEVQGSAVTLSTDGS